MRLDVEYAVMYVKCVSGDVCDAYAYQCYKSFMNVTNVKKIRLQFIKVCNSDKAYITQLNQQKVKTNVLLLLQHIAIMSTRS